MEREGAELGVLTVALEPEQRCLFQGSPAASLRAAVLRRLELLDPALSGALHGAAGGGQDLRPWTLSPLLGPLERRDRCLVAGPGQTYRVRLTALAPRMLRALDAVFGSDHPVANEPLFLERVAFRPVSGQTGWTGLTTYARVLTLARPTRRITLRFRSPTGFRRRDDAAIVPTPRLCVTGYVRKWNAFSDLALPEESLVGFAEDGLAVAHQDLRAAPLRLGAYAIPGVSGTVEWSADGEAPAMLRLVNALADYAVYCGTGIQTTQGMGQTTRIGGP